MRVASLWLKDDRWTDGRAIAFSEREREFTFAKNRDAQKKQSSHKAGGVSHEAGRKNMVGKICERCGFWARSKTVRELKIVQFVKIVNGSLALRRNGRQLPITIAMCLYDWCIGLAFYQAICTPFSATIIREAGEYPTASTIAHELGHTSVTHALCSVDFFFTTGLDISLTLYYPQVKKYNKFG